MFLQDNYSYGKILDKKKYLEAKDVDFNLPDPSKPLKGSLPKLSKLQSSADQARSPRASNFNLGSARDSENGRSAPRFSKLGQLSNDKSAHTLPPLEKSLLSNRSLLSGKHTRSWYQSASKLSIVIGGSEYDETGLANLSTIFGANPKVSEFSDKHLGSLSDRISTLPSEYNEIDQPLEKPVDIEALLMQLMSKDQTYSPIRVIHANSNIGLDCTKNQRMYFKVKCDGYKFPMKVRFSKRNLHFQIFISFVHRRPDELKNEYQSTKHAFEVPLSAMWSSSSQPIATEDVKVASVYMCISPDGDFKDTMAVTFDARDTKGPTEVAASHQLDGIDYKGLLKFSDQYQKNVHTLKYYQKLEAKKEQMRSLNKSKLSGEDDENNTSGNQDSQILNKSALSNPSLYDPDMLVDFKKKRQMKIVDMARLDDHRRDLAKVKSKLLQRQREEEIINRKAAREGSILHKREIIEGMLQALVHKTMIRGWVAHLFLSRVVESVSTKVKRIRAERDMSLKKLSASFTLVRAFKRFLRSQKREKYVTLTEETKKEVKFYQVSIKDSTSTLMITNLICKQLKWTKVVPTAMQNLGQFYKSVSRAWILSDKFLDFRRRVQNLQRSFRNFKYLKRVYIKHGAPILEEALKDIQRIAEERKMTAVKQNLKGGLQHTATQVLEYLFEHHLCCFVKEKYATSELPYKEFKTLSAKVDDLQFAALKVGATLAYTQTGLNTQKYSKIVNPRRQKDMRDEIAVLDPTIVTVKNKQRDEQLKKLKVILKLVCDKLEGSRRFVFEFNDISARLFLIGYFQLDKIPEFLAVHEICSHSTVYDQDAEQTHAHTDATD